MQLTKSKAFLSAQVKYLSVVPPKLSLSLKPGLAFQRLLLTLYLVRVALAMDKEGVELEMCTAKLHTFPDLPPPLPTAAASGLTRFACLCF